MSNSHPCALILDQSPMKLSYDIRLTSKDQEIGF